MKCPVCGNNYRPYLDDTHFQQDGITVQATHFFFCPNCESSWSRVEYFTMTEPLNGLVIIHKGDAENFEFWKEPKKMNECKALHGCGYWYQDDGDDFPCCHYPSDDPWPAPCEYEDDE